MICFYEICDIGIINYLRKQHKRYQIREFGANIIGKISGIFKFDLIDVQDVLRLVREEGTVPDDNFKSIIAYLPT